MTKTRLYIMNYQGFKDYIKEEIRLHEESKHMMSSMSRKPDEHFEAQYNALQELQRVNNFGGK